MLDAGTFRRILDYAEADLSKQLREKFEELREDCRRAWKESDAEDPKFAIGLRIVIQDKTGIYVVNTELGWGVRKKTVGEAKGFAPQEGSLPFPEGVMDAVRGMQDLADETGTTIVMKSGSGRSATISPKNPVPAPSASPMNRVIDPNPSAEELGAAGIPKAGLPFAKGPGRRGGGKGASA